MNLLHRARHSLMLHSSLKSCIPVVRQVHVCITPQQVLVNNISFTRHYCKTHNSGQANSINHEEHHSEEKKSDSEETTTADEDFTEDQLRGGILDAALPFVKMHGWSTEAISCGAETLGYSSMVHGMFTEGGVDLVNHHNKCCNIKLEQILKEWIEQQQKQPNVKKSTTKFLRDAIKARLEMNIEYISTWPQAMALNANPSNASNALFNIGTLVDHLWYYAGDRSSDFNWYTKRGVVALVYKSTELCMVQDNSMDYKETWEFLDRRLEDIHSAAKCIKDANIYTKDITSLAQAGVLTALNIIGMNKKSR